MVSNPLVRQMSDTLSEKLPDLPNLRRGSVLKKKPQLKRHSSDFTGLSNRLQRISIVPQTKRHGQKHVPVGDNIRRRESLYKATLSRDSLQYDHVVDVNDSNWSKTDRRGTPPPEDLSVFITDDARYSASKRKDQMSFNPLKASKRRHGTQRQSVKAQNSIESLPDRLLNGKSSRGRGSPRSGRQHMKRQRTFPQLVKKVNLVNMLGRNHDSQMNLKKVTFHKEQLKKKVALHRFRRAGRMIQLLLRAVDDIKSNYTLRKKKRADEILAESAVALPGTTESSSLDMLKRSSGLMFNPADFKPRKKGKLSPEVKKILSKSPDNRKPEEIRMVQMSLQSAMEAFAEFPRKMQDSLAKVAWYESFEPNRVIIRQGHRSETYYLILSGTAMVTVSSSEYGMTGDPGIKHVAFLKKGNSFGEIAVMHHAKRAATVVCKDTVELIAIDREDFIDIFMHRSPSGRPDFLHFLQTIPELAEWPVHLLPDNDPTICLFTFFRRGVVICKDSNKSDWIYIIKSGRCRVLKKLAAPTKLFEARSALLDVFELTDVHNTGILKTPYVSPRGGESRHHRNMTYQHGGKFKAVQSSMPERSCSIKLPKIGDSQLNHRPHFLKADSKLQMDLPNGPITPKVIGHTDDEKTVYLQIQQLSDKDIFGLQTILFVDDELVSDTKTPSVTLVSDGAECVMLSKRFFLQHLSSSHRFQLNKSIRPYPSEENLHQKLQQQTTWEKYKCRTMQKAIHSHSKATELSHSREHHSTKEY